VIFRNPRRVSLAGRVKTSDLENLRKEIESQPEKEQPDDTSNRLIDLSVRFEKLQKESKARIENLETELQQVILYFFLPALNPSRLLPNWVRKRGLSLKIMKRL